ncbi:MULTISPECIES: hypothetical protein [unclassified Spirillospora]|uniref:hypothetical protein n=1 Tax=unclassified Spirillospora TaxID=2642701 RepID=UPI00371EF9F5
MEMTWMSRLHRLILCADIERFSDSDRSDAHRVAAHDGMYDAVEAALGACGVTWADCYHEDRGDGLLLLFRPDVPKDRVVRDLPWALAAALAEHNHVHAVQAQVRLRIAVHAGEVQHDGRGVVGDAVNAAFRLLDARPLRDALATSSGSVAVIASEPIYHDVIRHTPASRPDTYRQIEVEVKETRTTAWVCLPDDARSLGGSTGTRTPSSPVPDLAGSGGEVAADDGVAPPGTSMRARASGAARIFQAGRDQHITES